MLAAGSLVVYGKEDVTSNADRQIRKHIENDVLPALTTALRVLDDDASDSNLGPTAVPGPGSPTSQGTVRA